MAKITKEANPDPLALNKLIYTDDQTIVNGSEDKLQQHTDSLNTEGENHGMKVSIEKTEVMTVGRTPKKLEISINGQLLKQSPDFKYLGSLFTEDGKLNREIESKIQKATAFSYQLAALLRHPNIPMDTKSFGTHFLLMSEMQKHVPKPR
ncbi:uncharacterized protein LOC144916731 [Branchiostoma floridae x Branchiostoma belcheri]